MHLCVHDTPYTQRSKALHGDSRDQTQVGSLTAGTFPHSVTPESLNDLIFENGTEALREVLGGRQSCRGL